MKEELIGNLNQKGLATLEVLLAFAVITLAIGAAIMLTFGNQTSAINNQTNIEAISLAEKMIEDSRSLSRFDFQSVVPIAATLSTAGSISYTKSLEVSQIDFFTKQATSTVSWQESGRSLFVTFSTLLSNPHAVSSSDTCSSILSGDWKNPILSSWEFGKDIANDPSSGFPIGDIDLYQNKLYVVVNNSNGNNSPTLFILSIDPKSPSSKPILEMSIDNDTTVKTGLNGITVTNQYAFVANGLGPTKGQLQIIDLNPNPPVVIKTFKIPGVSGSSSQAVGQTVAHKDGYVYLGLTKTGSGPEFNIIDVGGGTGSKTNPIWVGGYSIGNGINAITVKDSFAYIASPNNEELTILDITDKANPVRVGGFNAPDNQGNGKSIHIKGTFLYLGRTVTSANPELYIVDIKNPNSVPTSPLGTKEIGSSINGILTRDYLTFLLTNSQFQILNTQNPSAITSWASPLPMPGGNGTSLDCEGNYVFFSSVPTNDKGYIAVVTPRN